jgi:hypothetical protein
LFFNNCVNNKQPCNTTTGELNMTDRAQFEAMLEALINENHDAAKEIFHNIVVGKSREIYEELLESDFSQDQGNPYSKKDDEEEVSEEGEEEMPMAEEDDEEADDAEDDSEADDAEDDSEEDDMDIGGEEDSEGGDMEDRVMDLEDALEDLKAEFEQLLAGEEGEEHMGGDDMGGMHDMGEPGGEMDELEQMMEYVDKVSPPKHGDNGANAKSIVAGKNDMGGTTANIAKSFSTTSGGTQGGLLKPTTTLQDGGNINKPGGNAGKTGFKKKEPGHGAESKGKGETADNKQSLLRPLKK